MAIQFRSRPGFHGQMNFERVVLNYFKYFNWSKCNIFQGLLNPETIKMFLKYVYQNTIFALEKWYTALPKCLNLRGRLHAVVKNVLLWQSHREPMKYRWEIFYVAQRRAHQSTDLEITAAHSLLPVNIEKKSSEKNFSFDFFGLLRWDPTVFMT